MLGQPGAAFVTCAAAFPALPWPPSLGRARPNAGPPPLPHPPPRRWPSPPTSASCSRTWWSRPASSEPPAAGPWGGLGRLGRACGRAALGCRCASKRVLLLVSLLTPPPPPPPHPPTHPPPRRLCVCIACACPQRLQARAPAGPRRHAGAPVLHILQALPGGAHVSGGGGQQGEGRGCAREWGGGQQGEGLGRAAVAGQQGLERGSGDGCVRSSGRAWRHRGRGEWQRVTARLIWGCRHAPLLASGAAAAA